MMNNPQIQLLEDLNELLAKHKTRFELCTSQDFALAKQRALRRTTREEIDRVLEEFFVFIV